MNYQKTYDQIVEKARSENRKKKQGVYYENHHIIPRCLGGLDKKENLVLLTGREHFICHKLLAEIHPNSYKLANSVWLMIFRKSGNQQRYYKVSSREYERFKIKHSIANSFYLKGVKKPPVSEETKAKIKETKRKNGTVFSYESILLGLETRRRNGSLKHSEETKIKIGNRHRGRKHSEEYKRHCSERTKGRKLSPETILKLTGKKASLETRQKMSKTRIGRVLSDDWKNNISKGHKGKQFSASHKESLSKAKLGTKRPKYIGENHSKKMKGFKYDKIQCPYCLNLYPINVIKRYHFEKCKQNTNKLCQ